MTAKTDHAAEDEHNQVQPEDQELSLLDHLTALRKALIISAAAVLIGFACVFSFAIDWLMALLTRPITQRGITIVFTAVSEALVTKFKVALVAGIIVAFPVIVWQVWKFIQPALYAHEKRLFRAMFFAALLLFLIGIVFCVFAVYSLALDFFMVSGENLAEPMLSIDKYIGFLAGFILPFGIAFMLPVFLYITTRLGITNAKMLAGCRKYVILGLAVFAAILTPPDVVSQVMLLIPMLLLYEVSILVSRLTKQRMPEEN